MKASLFIVSILGLCNAVNVGDNDPLTTKFPNDCSSEQTCSFKCCNFDDTQGNKLKRCMSSDQTGGNLDGTYTDDQLAEFTWKCPSDESS